MNHHWSWVPGVPLPVMSYASLLLLLLYTQEIEDSTLVTVHNFSVPPSLSSTDLHPAAGFWCLPSFIQREICITVDLVEIISRLRIIQYSWHQLVESSAQSVFFALACPCILQLQSMPVFSPGSFSIVAPMSSAVLFL